MDTEIKNEKIKSSNESYDPEIMVDLKEEDQVISEEAPIEEVMIKGTREEITTENMLNEKNNYICNIINTKQYSSTNLGTPKEETCEEGKVIVENQSINLNKINKISDQNTTEDKNLDKEKPNKDSKKKPFICRFYSKGQCNRGNKCEYIHEGAQSFSIHHQLQDIICPFFSYGMCVDTCNYKHEILSEEHCPDILPTFYLEAIMNAKLEKIFEEAENDFLAEETLEIRKRILKTNNESIGLVNNNSKYQYPLGKGYCEGNQIGLKSTFYHANNNYSNNSSVKQIEKSMNLSVQKDNIEPEAENNTSNNIIAIANSSNNMRTENVSQLNNQESLSKGGIESYTIRNTQPTNCSLEVKENSIFSKDVFGTFNPNNTTTIMNSSANQINFPNAKYDPILFLLESEKTRFFILSQDEDIIKNYYQFSIIFLKSPIYFKDREEKQQSKQVLLLFNKTNNYFMGFMELIENGKVYCKNDFEAKGITFPENFNFFMQINWLWEWRTISQKVNNLVNPISKKQLFECESESELNKELGESLCKFMMKKLPKEDTIEMFKLYLPSSSFATTQDNTTIIPLININNISTLSPVTPKLTISIPVDKNLNETAFSQYTLVSQETPVIKTCSAEPDSITKYLSDTGRMNLKRKNAGTSIQLICNDGEPSSFNEFCQTNNNNINLNSKIPDLNMARKENYFKSTSKVFEEISSSQIGGPEQYGYFNNSENKESKISEEITNLNNTNPIKVIDKKKLELKSLIKKKTTTVVNESETSVYLSVNNINTDLNTETASKINFNFNDLKIENAVNSPTATTVISNMQLESNLQKVEIPEKINQNDSNRNNNNTISSCNNNVSIVNNTVFVNKISRNREKRPIEIVLRHNKNRNNQPSKSKHKKDSRSIEKLELRENNHSNNRKRIHPVSRSKERVRRKVSKDILRDKDKDPRNIKYNYNRQSNRSRKHSPKSLYSQCFQKSESPHRNFQPPQAQDSKTTSSNNIIITNKNYNNIKNKYYIKNFINNNVVCYKHSHEHCCNCKGNTTSKIFNIAEESSIADHSQAEKTQKKQTEPIKTHHGEGKSSRSIKHIYYKTLNDNEFDYWKLKAPNKNKQENTTTIERKHSSLYNSREYQSRKNKEIEDNNTMKNNTVGVNSQENEKTSSSFTNSKGYYPHQKEFHGNNNRVTSKPYKQEDKFLSTKRKGSNSVLIVENSQKTSRQIQLVSSKIFTEALSKANAKNAYKK